LSAAELAGTPSIVDADTVYLGMDKIRLRGIDAPETDQVCLDSRGQKSSCGVEAKVRLQEHTGGRRWICQVAGRDRYGRNLGTCFVDGEDVSRWLVRNGWALAFRRYSMAYVADEEYARQKKTDYGAEPLLRHGIGAREAQKPSYWARLMCPQMPSES
jgi:endonuclease YncB( thermonuclease family)